MQEFELEATGDYQAFLDELDDQLDLLREVDCKARGFRGWLQEMSDADKRLIRIQLRAKELESAIETLVGLLERVIQQQLES